MLGEHQIGAVFPPLGDPARARQNFAWAWRFWLGSLGTTAVEGVANTELKAKNAILAEARDWLRKAGLQA